MEKNQKDKLNKKSNKHSVAIIASICVTLLLGVIATTALLGNRLGEIAPKEVSVIELVSNEKMASGSIKNTIEKKDTSVVSTEDITSEEEANAPSVAKKDEDPEPATKVQGGGASFIAQDDEQVWDTETEIEIFHASYDETGNITVKSSTDDKVIAPGTDNDYEFQFKNNGSVPVEYDMEVEAYITPKDWDIPIVAALTRDGEKYLAGSANAKDAVLDLDGVTDEGTLDVNNYASYKLSWSWPFEAGDEGDALDTALGNRAVDEDLICTIKIKVRATAEEPTTEEDTTEENTTEEDSSEDATDSTEDPSNPDKPQTGDYIPIILVAIVGGAAFVILVILLILRRKKNDDEEDKGEDA